MRVVLGHALATGISSSRVVYCGVRRSCFMPQDHRGPNLPVAVIVAGPELGERANSWL